MKALIGLNNQQVEAAKETEGYVRVIAGAGSGKTRLLVSRYAYLVSECGIDSSNILCVTFTNKAAAEMKKRIRELIGPEHDTSLICTYHGFCARLLREDSEKLFLPKDFQIIDTSQQKNILADIFQKYELKLNYATFEKMMSDITAIKIKNKYVKRMCNPDKCQILESISTLNDRIIEEYMQKQKATYSLDFNDLIGFALYLLQFNDEIRKKWENRLNYVLVDEFQDSSNRELKLLDLVSSRYKNLMIVGDPDQNIYEWRGSDVKLLVDFDKTHEPTKTFILNQNYRSTPQILNCANLLIEHNDMRIKKDLFTEAEDGALVIHYHSKTEEAENNAITDNIKRLVGEDGYRYSDVAVLYRAGFLSRPIEKKFNECNIPYEIYGGVKFFQRMEVQDVIAYLRLIEYQDDEALKRIINVPRRKFGRAKMKYLESLRDSESAASNELRTLYSILKENINDKMFKSSDAADFIHFIEEMRIKAVCVSISELVNSLMEESGYESYIRELGDEERLENLAEFKRFANEFEDRFGESQSLNEFLHQIALQSEEGDDDERDAVKLMTIHSAKGLEFPIVLLIGLSEGIFPNPKSIELRKKEGLEEERRLCYVAITRAKEHLFLMESEGESEKGQSKFPSRFLSEMGEESYQRIGKINKDLITPASSYIGSSESISEDYPELKVGEKVEHHIFGGGTVKEISEKTGSYVIQFDRLSEPRNISRSYFAGRREKDEMEDEPEPEIMENEDIELPSVHDNEKTAAIDDKYNGANLWKRSDVPHSGWTCIGITDLGSPSKICEMCGHQIIRYVHHMIHPHYHSLDVGCICAGRMEGNVDAAKKREQDFKSKQQRRQSFLKRTWKKSSKGNLYMKVKDHVIVLYEIKSGKGWKYSIDQIFCELVYPTRKEAALAAFEELDKK